MEQNSSQHQAMKTSQPPVKTQISQEPSKPEEPTYVEKPLEPAPVAPNMGQLRR